MFNIKSFITLLTGVLILSGGTLPAATQEEMKTNVKEAAALEFKDVDALEYVDMVLEDGILDDPEGYLQAWAIERGYTLEYRMPEDAVHSFFLKYFTKVVIREAAALEFTDLKALKYVDMVLEDGILDDPEGYLKAWIIERGNTRELRIPEDAVRVFFIKYFFN